LTDRKEKQKIYYKEWWAKHGRDQNLQKRYGIGVEDYQTMYEKQEGKCAICNKHSTSVFTKGAVGFELCVDHCHNTGKVRGILCQSCNVTLGKVEEKEEILLALIEYLKKHKGE
jgi:hypothetical protein